MCLLVLAWQTHPRYRLLVAANRDEYHDRPASALAPWADVPEILGGRDLRAGGTWLAIDRRRRFGTVTNFRELLRPRRTAPSRGELVPGFLRAEKPARAWLDALEVDAPGYSGFNLLLSDGDTLAYATNRGDGFTRTVAAGIHGLSNETLDAPWPKLLRVRDRFATVAERGDAIDTDELFAILADREPAGTDRELPATGLSLEWERLLSAPFVVDERYGTRSSTILALEHSGALTIAERRFDSGGEPSGEAEYILNADEWPSAGR
jgi:uncharacterized protein with NRDE domain